MGELLTAMVTIFKDDLSVDYGACADMAIYLLENGSDGLVVSGTTGESPTLTTDEKLKLFAHIKEAVGENVRVVAGTGTNCTETALRLTKEAEKTGVDEVMLVSPYYNKPPQEGLIKHFGKIAAQTDLPIIIYNVPSRTGSNIEADTTIELSKLDNIVAVKEASGKLEQIKKIIDSTDENFKVYSGDDSATFELMKIGANGVISVASHIIGLQTKKMLDLCVEGNLDEASELNDKLMPIFEGLFKATNPILVKAGLELIDQPGGPLRLPLVAANSKQRADLKELLSSSEVVSQLSNIGA